MSSDESWLLWLTIPFAQNEWVPGTVKSYTCSNPETFFSSTLNHTISDLAISSNLSSESTLVLNTAPDWASLINFLASFTNFNIVNVSSQAIIVYLNQARDRSFFIPASTSRTFARDDIQGGVQSLIIKNAGAGTIDASDIRLEVFKVGEQIEDAFQKIHKKFFKLGAF